MANKGEAARRDDWNGQAVGVGNILGVADIQKGLNRSSLRRVLFILPQDLIYSWVVDPLYRFNLFKGDSKYSTLSTFLIRLGITAETLNYDNLLCFGLKMLAESHPLSDNI